jgi:hypothetical protein
MEEFDDPLFRLYETNEGTEKEEIDLEDVGIPNEETLGVICQRCYDLRQRLNGMSFWKRLISDTNQLEERIGRLQTQAIKLAEYSNKKWQNAIQSG